jgi:hypothetical protein
MEEKRAEKRRGNENETIGLRREEEERNLEE